MEFTYALDKENYCKCCEKLLINKSKYQYYCNECYIRNTHQCERVFNNRERCENRTYMCKKTHYAYTVLCIKCIKYDLQRYNIIVPSNNPEDIINCHFHLMKKLNIDYVFKYFYRQPNLIEETDFRVILLNKIKRQKKLNEIKKETEDILNKIKISISFVNKKSKNVFTFLDTDYKPAKVVLL